MAYLQLAVVIVFVSLFSSTHARPATGLGKEDYKKVVTYNHVELTNKDYTCNAGFPVIHFVTRECNVNNFRTASNIENTDI